MKSQGGLAFNKILRNTILFPALKVLTLYNTDDRNTGCSDKDVCTCNKYIEIYK